MSEPRPPVDLGPEFDEWLEETVSEMRSDGHFSDVSDVLVALVAELRVARDRVETAERREQAVSLYREWAEVDALKAERDALAATLAKVRKSHADWVELLRTQGEIMTTAQRNAWIDCTKELGAALGVED